MKQQVDLLPFEKKLTEVDDTDEGNLSLWCAEEYDPHEALYEEYCGYVWNW